MKDQWMKKELTNKAYLCCINHECSNCPYNHTANKDDPEYIHQSFKQIYCDMIKGMIANEQK